METVAFDPPLLVTALRLGMAALLGGLIGLDRESRGKAAGFRTNILICVGAALLTMISIGIADKWAQVYATPGDPGRIAAQIVSGIGFLGAGTILQSRTGIRGLTTAATIWVVAAIGMAVGAGGYQLAVVATTGTVLTLVLLGKLEAWLEPRTTTERWIRVWLRRGAKTGRADIEREFSQRGLRIRTRDVERGEEGIRIVVRAEGRSADWSGLLDALLERDDVARASLE